MRANFVAFANALCHRNATPLNKAKMGQCLGGGLLSLSLSRCSHFLAHLWVKFKGLFYSFCRSFFSSYRKFFLFYRSFLSSFCLQKAFFRAFCLFENFKRCVCALLRPFCHFEPLQKGDPTGCKAQAAAKKSTKIKRKLAILGYFACAQYDKFRQKPKFDSLPHFNVIKARNDGLSCHFERSEKSKEFKIRFVYGYFANAQYDKIYDAKSVWYDKFGLLFKNNGYFHSNFKAKIHKIHIIHSHFKAKIQIFYSKFKAFHKFNSFCKFKAFYKFNSFHKFHSKFNSFHNFISNFKPYTRLFYIFTPNFRAVFTDKFSRKEELWQQLAQKAGQEQSRRLKATENAAKPTK